MEAAVTEEAYMRLALELAAEAAAEGEVPVGAVIVLGGSHLRCAPSPPRILKY